MKTNAVFTRPIRAEETSRQIVLRTRGHSHGRVTRLVSPGDIGELIKPFVFLDYFDTDPATAPEFGFHPHSGIATLTVILAGQAFYEPALWAFAAFMLLATGAILSLGPYRYPAEEKTPAGTRRVVDAPATEHA
jgi:hypothetical protein